MFNLNKICSIKPTWLNVSYVNAIFIHLLILTGYAIFKNVGNYSVKNVLINMFKNNSSTVSGILNVLILNVSLKFHNINSNKFSDKGLMKCIIKQ